MRPHARSFAAITLAGACVGALAQTPIPSASVFSNGTDYDTRALTEFATFSADMVGSQVTVRFVDGTTESVSWAAAGALGTGWSLVLRNDSFIAGAWKLSNDGSRSIKGLTFDGRPGNTVFDVVPFTVNSPGSLRGKPLGDVFAANNIGFAQGNYRDRLSVDGIWYEDLYLVLDIDFRFPFLAGDLFYSADTDNIDVQLGGITPVVPEPGTYGLMAVGLASLLSLARGRRTRQA